METITVMENEYCVLWYHPDWKIVHHRILKFPELPRHHRRV